MATTYVLPSGLTIEKYGNGSITISRNKMSMVVIAASEKEKFLAALLEGENFAQLKPWEEAK